MAKTRMEKNKKIYADLEKEMKNSKENTYEEKLKNLDPMLQNTEEDFFAESETNVKKTESKSNNDNVLAVIAKEVNGKKVKKNELVEVKENKKVVEEEEEEVFTDPISFTDKLSVEEILRAKIEKQSKLKNEKRIRKKSPTDENYTASMMQARIKQHEGVDVRREAKVKTKNFKWLALGLLILALIAIITLGCLVIFKIIEV